MTSDRDRLTCYAKMALVASRHNDMVDTMKKFATSYEMTSEERDLFYLAFKGQFDEPHNSLQQLNEHLENAKARNNQIKIDAIEDLKKKIIKEVLSICSDVVKFLNEHLIKDHTSSDRNLFFVTMKGDFYRYIYEVNPNEHTKDMVISSYELGKQISQSFTERNVVELDLYYKYASFRFKQLKDSSSAMDLLNSAIVKVNGIRKTLNDALKFMRV